MAERKTKPRGRWVARHEIWHNGEQVARQAGDEVPDDVVQDAGHHTMQPEPWVDWVED